MILAEAKVVFYFSLRNKISQISWFDENKTVQVWHMINVIKEDQKLLERIAINPKIMAGKPVIKGTRLTVEYILNLLAHGATLEEILQEYEDLTKEDIRACLLFAGKSLENTEFMPLAVEV